MRNKTSAGSRPRPKTIHVDSGGVGSGGDMQEGILSPSRSKKGSTSNLTGNQSTSVSTPPYLHICLSDV
jgi:calmodulin-regulated spectrin-associated protein